jgi:hypothetical protein
MYIAFSIMAQDPKLVMPINLVFSSKDRVVAFVQQAYAGSAMYQISYGHIATIEGKENKEIKGWKFLFEPHLEITTGGITDPYASFHVNVLLAKKPPQQTTAFPEFPIHKVFSCGKDDGITNLLINLLSINRSFDDLLKELQINPGNFQYISVLGFHHAPTLTQNSSQIGNPESEIQYAAYLEKKIEEQKKKKDEQKKIDEEKQRTTSTKSIWKKQYRTKTGRGGNKKKYKKSKRKPMSKKKRTVKLYQKK